MEGATGDTKRTLLDLGGGYVQESKGWAVGALYATDKTSSGSGEADRTAMGPMFGWISQKDNGAYVFGTYFLSANLTGGYTGNGYQFDVGYKFAVRKVSFGAQLSKKHITFDKLNGQSISPKYVEDKIDPYVVMFIDF